MRTLYYFNQMLMYSSVGNRRQEMAIFIREIGKESQFYTMTGRWMHRLSSSVDFFVPGFVQPHELDSLRPYLPDGPVPNTVQDRLQGFKDTLPVTVGQPLLRKMLDFWDHADATYQTAAPKLDKAHSLVAHKTAFSYATLDEIANKVIADVIPKGADGVFPPSVLYAVHRAILKDDIGFTPQPNQLLRSKTQYEINGIREVNALAKITAWVREQGDLTLGQSKGKSSLDTEMNKFVKKAQQVIDNSRKNRPFTPHGMIGPSSISLNPGEPFRAGQVTTTYDKNEMIFINFLESWACFRSFGPGSQLNGVGSAILRAMDRYEEVPLNNVTAWTCLQELGIIPPWETIASFELRLPSIGRQEAVVPRTTAVEDHHLLGASYTKDRLDTIREAPGENVVFCVDSADALEIDDGISLETTNNPEEYWVHIHTADPASVHEPSGLIAQFAHRLGETVYLPERHVPMLNSLYVRKRLSLAKGKKCLVFSAKMNLQGEILASKITASTIGTLRYITPDTLSKIASNTGPAPQDTYTVGLQKSLATSTRKLTEELPEPLQEQLKVLYEIGKARTKQLESKGGISSGYPKHEAAVIFDGTPWTEPTDTDDKSLQYFGDPTIQIRVDHMEPGVAARYYINTVASFMIVAGEVAARWCNDRGIPVPYRITPRQPEKQDPSEFYRQTILPARDENGQAPVELQKQYFDLIGKVQPSSTPGPHVALGLDMFVKITSPLRRYGDLIAHWQIEAAMLEEAKTGTSLVGNTRDDFLPFSKARLDEILPSLVTREKVITAGHRRSARVWLCQFLLRAWKYGECELPYPLEFTVRSINPDSGALGGIVTKLLAGGKIQTPSWTTIEDIKVGDRFEVEIEDILVYDGQVKYKAVKSLESEDELAAKAKASREAAAAQGVVESV